MDKDTIIKKAAEQFAELSGNTLTEEMAIDPRYVGTVMFDAPIVGFGSTDDTLFDEYKKPEIIGPWHMHPKEWLDGAKTVISLFFPLSEEVRRSNYGEKDVSSVQWAYARVDGQEYIGRYMTELKGWLEANGVRCCVPALDVRFAMLRGGKGIEGEGIDENSYGSRWSERHAAYVCGLGTFSLSKGLITRKGVAGRFASLICDLPLEADVREYTGIYDYCINCGACVKRCPVNAIDPVKGKDHAICDVNVKRSGIIHAPRYGCGLCQTKVPCEKGIPKLNAQ